MFDHPTAGRPHHAPRDGVSDTTETLPLTIPPASSGVSDRNRTERPAGRRSASRLIFRLLVALAVAVLALGEPFLGSVSDRLGTLRTPVERTAAYWRGAAETAGAMVMAVLAEEPSLGRLTGAARTPFCDDVVPEDQRPVADAINLMRRTTEGERLFSQLVDAGICIRSGDIPYNSGYAYMVKSFGSWSRSYIKIATRHVQADEPDVLAALLVHEATHVDRYLNAKACTFEENCTILENGVELEEEIAAHAAEAEWWIEAYGEDGKRFAFGYDFGQNQLVKAYLRGPDAFAAYIRQIRGDPREASHQS